MADEPNRECERCKKLEARVARLESEVESLKAYASKLLAALEESRRSGKRQAAPFRKNPKEQKAPKKPGRKSGDDHGNHAHRLAPKSIDETYHVELPKRSSCCGSKVNPGDDTRQQFQTDIVVSVIHREFNLEVGTCNQCGTTVTGRHELQTSDSTGAAGNQFGPWCHAAFAVLNKSYGLSYGKIQRLFGEMLGLNVPRATAARSILRTARRLESAGEEIQQEVRGSPRVTPDETGWRVGGASAWLHAFATPKAVWYEVDLRRNASVIFRLLGKDWNGFLIHDGWSPYDKMTQATHQQCTAHLLRRCSELLETAVGPAARFPRQVKALLQRGLEQRLKYQRGNLTKGGLASTAGRLKRQLKLLVLPERKHEANNRFAWFLHNHLDQIFTYLWHPEVEATNWRGEHAIRPAVVNRKVWGGNRTWVGANAQGLITSVIETARLKSCNPHQYLLKQLTLTAS